jgi:hypothetical protein
MMFSWESRRVLLSQGSRIMLFSRESRRVLLSQEPNECCCLRRELILIYKGTF